MSDQRVTLRVDPEKCCSAGLCAAALPEVFDQDEIDGRVLLLQPSPPAALADGAREAAYCCPSGAISVAEEGTTRDGET
jgi:ferredoxin